MRLVVVSNRVAYDEKPQAGGLASAIQNSLAKRNGLWIGWSGEISEEKKEFQCSHRNIHFQLFSLTPKEYQDYYLSFSNEIIWPISHLRSSYINSIASSYKTYHNVNRKFARAALQHLQADDVVWVHDYHLLLTGKHLRALGFQGKTGYFHHIPIPPPEFIQTIPHHCALLSGLLSYDLVGVQTRNDLKNLLGYYEYLAEKDTNLAIIKHADYFLIECAGRSTKFANYPISIDTRGIEKLAQASTDLPDIQQLKTTLAQHPLIIGVDRLDHSKGLENKYDALEQYLKQFPCAPSPVLLQIANKSRHDIDSYQILSTQLESMACKINADHGSTSYTPIHHRHTVYSHEVLAGLYRMAKVGLVTPTKDGMNLVAKEYVAAQNPKDPGVLVLSEFAGAAAELTQALIVNPFDTTSVTQALHAALHMPLAERIQRHQALLHTLRQHDIHAWCAQFLGDLRATQNQPALQEVLP